VKTVHKIRDVRLIAGTLSAMGAFIFQLPSDPTHTASFSFLTPARQLYSYPEGTYGKAALLVLEPVE
jgi:hypothetical protein